MDYSKLTLMRMMQIKMGYLSERQDVLSQNVANVDTPGYQARDMRELDFRNLAMAEARKLKMRATSVLHSTGIKKMTDDYRDERSRHTFETTPVENNVVLEQQMAKISDTQMQYQLTTNMYKKTTDLFKTAIGNR
tara:strand:- start:231 stop:635 length:405 start_codon:yes stop_codon:yes gene_type:complete